ncbi:MAG: CoA ester lyase [Xanthobacteraceae bacterium]|nr:CoA ester lyase [Xanthobacteraceae bacterium]
MIRPRRSLLFMPGSNPRALDKARSLPVDGVILDLEDAVAPEAKDTARDLIGRTIAAGGFGSREVMIRINGLDTPWWGDDLAMAARARPDGIVVPKVSSVADLAQVAERLAAAEAPGTLKVWAMIETALALLHVEALSATGQQAGSRLAGYIMGPNDIARETRIRMVPGRGPMLPFYTTCVLAAHAYGLEILDGPFSDFSDAAGFSAECAQSRDMGFDGKTLIHPSQIEACNAAFTPPPHEVAQARAIVAAFERPENAGRGAIQLDGRMVERLHAEIARRTLAIADAIEGKK